MNAHLNKRSKWPTVLWSSLALAVGLGVGHASAGGSTTPPVQHTHTTAATPTPPPNTKTPDAHQGVFVVEVRSTGSSVGSVSYMVPKGGFNLSQDTNASFPFRKTWKHVSSVPLGWNMNAQQSGGGRLTCIVKYDGKVIARNHSSGDYTTVSCSPQ